MSYILLVTETSDLAADLLVIAAERRGIPILRFNQDEFPQDIEVAWHGAEGFSLRSAQFQVFEREIVAAWFRKNRRRVGTSSEVSAFVSRESDGFLNGIWETTGWTWMNRPSAVRQAEHKLLQLRHAARLGFEIPDTLVTNAPEAARLFARARPVIAKTVAGAGLTLGGVDQVIFTSPVSASDLDHDDAIKSCPLILQTKVRKSFDLRVTVVGERVFTARIMVRCQEDDEIDWRAIDETRLVYECDELPPDFAARCIKLVSDFGLLFGAIDFVVAEDGRRVFLELNPSGQWGWLERALQLPISDAILERLN